MTNLIQMKKEQFLAKYNTGRNREMAAQRAVTAAVQHNLVYNRGITGADRETVRSAWVRKLDEIAKEYVGVVSIEVHDTAIEKLAHALNQDFGKFFVAETGFKISHAQKSLSVFLKHLWCMGCIGEPPQCPVDRQILKEAQWPWKGLCWTRVTTIEQHRLHIAHLRTAARPANQSLAVWELMNFDLDGS